MELDQHFATIWGRRWRIIVATIAVTALVFAWRESRPRVYAASSLLSITPARSANVQLPTKDDVEFLADTYGRLATTRPVVAQALQDAALTIPLGTAVARVSVDASRAPGFIQLRVTGSTPQQAEKFAGALAARLVATVAKQQQDIRVKDLDDINAQVLAAQQQLQATPPGSQQRSALESQIAALNGAKTDVEVRSVDRAQLVAPARAESAPVSPHPLRDTLLAFVVALVINSELVVAIDALSDRFSQREMAEEITQLTGLPVLARVPRGSDDETLEEIRSLRTGLMLVATTVRTVAVVSAEQGSGKSYLSLRLAREVAALDIPVLLIDADLRRPAIHEDLGMQRSPGLSDVLQGRTLARAAVPVPGISRLQVLPAGTPVPDPSGLLGAASLSTIVRQAPYAEFVVVDTPAADFFADAMTMASQCDITLVVVNAQQSRRRSLRKLMAELRRVEARPIGVVVNLAPNSSRSAQYYYSRSRRPA